MKENRKNWRINLRGILFSGSQIHIFLNTYYRTSTQNLSLLLRLEWRGHRVSKNIDNTSEQTVPSRLEASLFKGRCWIKSFPILPSSPLLNPHIFFVSKLCFCLSITIIWYPQALEFISYTETQSCNWRVFTES